MSTSFKIMNAAGWCKGTGPEFDELLKSSVTSITIGSVTTDFRLGNPTEHGQTFVTFDDGSGLNSLGMPNPGIKYFTKRLREMAELANSVDKKLRINIAEFTPAGYANLIRIIADIGFGSDIEIEINLGCPNVWGDQGQKPIASFNLDVIEEILVRTGDIDTTDIVMALKLSPYSDPSMVMRVAKLIQQYSFVSQVVTSNTYPNALDFIESGSRRGQPVIPVGPGLAGASGADLFRIALGQTFQFVQAFRELGYPIEVIHAGGISSGLHAWKAVDCAGANGIEIGTAFFTRKLPGAGRIFSDILEQYAEIKETA